MTFGLKVYYLLQASYWVQQFILLAARVEKPRKDFKELVAHVSTFPGLAQGFADRQHIVTLWLIGWSYSLNLTYIGNAVFVSMDVSDIFLAVCPVQSSQSVVS
jgi:acyl-CoA-dependent ceramide synthase